MYTVNETCTKWKQTTDRVKRYTIFFVIPAYALEICSEYLLTVHAIFIVTSNAYGTHLEYFRDCEIV